MLTLLLLTGLSLLALKRGTRGVGALDDNEYVITLTSPAYNHNGVQVYYWDVFCGYGYRDGETWARWCNPKGRWMEYDEKVYKTRKGAEKALRELIERGEGGEQGEMKIMTLRDYWWRVNN